MRESVEPPRRVPGVPRAVVIGSELSWRLLACAAGVAALAYLLWQVRFVALPAILAVLLCTVLVPPARAMRARGLSAGSATSIVFFVGMLLFVGLALWIIPALISESEALAEQVRAGADELGRQIASLGIGVTEAEAQRTIASIDDRLRENSGALAGGLLSGALVVGQVLAGAILTLVLLFFFLRDGARLWEWVVRVFPDRAETTVRAVGETGWRVLSAYVRGISLVALFDAFFIGLGLAILGVPLVIPLALLTFFAAFLPVVGAYASGLACVLVALVSEGMVDALVVVAIIMAVQQFESNVIMPILIGRTTDLHPVAILLAVATGGVTAGIIGAFVAVPMAAVIAAAIPAARRAREQARRGAPQETAAHRGAAATAPEPIGGR